MGFFGTIKQWMGIGGVRVQIQPTSPDISMGGGTILGKIDITTKSDQLITKLTVKVFEENTRGSGENKTTEEFVLGTMVVGTDISIKTGESKTIEFQVPHAQTRSFTDQLASKSGVIGALGKIGKFASDERTVYMVHAHAAVKGALGSNAKSNLRPIP